MIVDNVYLVLTNRDLVVLALRKKLAFKDFAGHGNWKRIMLRPIFR